MHGLNEAAKSAATSALGSGLAAGYQPPRPKRSRKLIKERGSSANVTT